MLATTNIPFDKSDSFDPLILDMAKLSVGASIQQGLRGYGVQYISELSQPGGIILINQRVPLYPGAGFEGAFEGLQVEQHPLNQQLSGPVYLLVKKKPNVNFYEPGWNPQQSNTFNLLSLTSPQTADFTGFSLLGLNGLTTVLGNVVPFCFTGFRRIMVVLKWASLGTVGSSPFLNMFGLASPVLSPLIQIQRLVTQDASAGGGYISTAMFMGQGYPHEIDKGGSPNESPLGQYTPVIPPYAIFTLSPSGTFTTITSATITIYGLT